MAVQFYKEDVTFRLPSATKLPGWIRSVIRRHGKKTGDITYVFCSDPYLRQMNIRYLSHRTYTDILTFDTSSTKDITAGDIFISVDRVRSNASGYGVTFRDELHRVMIHGILHLLGYDDKNDAAQKSMRRKEDECLAMRRFL